MPESEKRAGTRVQCPQVVLDVLAQPGHEWDITGLNAVVEWCATTVLPRLTCCAYDNLGPYATRDDALDAVDGFVVKHYSKWHPHPPREEQAKRSEERQEQEPEKLVRSGVFWRWKPPEKRGEELAQAVLGYLKKALRRYCWKLARDRRREVPLDELPDRAAPPSGPEASRAEVDASTVRELNVWLKPFTQRQRRVARRRLIWGQPYKEIARILRTSEGNARIICHRMVKKLGRRLQQGAPRRCNHD